ncbi:MAG: response regulator [Natronospirillum sp.]|uniref:response regulator n=1 Tax=Natronospirillum sp. TaxID=2812955 RepID=UPI0025F48413|nr:response regulator [Natronospirillum sp.]MCH8552865.1 response regulator [Natronospirillum sp.]
MARVLVVEDSPSTLAAFRKALENAGHSVIAAADGNEAIGKARADQPDVILMDIVMPEMNGFQATRRLTSDAETSHIPVVMVTTKDQETDRMWGKRQGAVGYLTKPVTDKDLVREVERVLT